MKTATITEMKNRLSAYLDRVRAGESVLILDRGVPVARLEPVAASGDPAGRAERLERAGILKPAVAAPPLDVVQAAGPRPADGASAVAALLEERRGGR
jgi:prevent-host-death family protein